MSLTNNALDRDWEALAAKETADVTAAYLRPRVGAAATLDRSANTATAGSPGRYASAASSRGGAGGGSPPAASLARERGGGPNPNSTLSVLNVTSNAATLKSVGSVANANASTADVFARGALIRVPSKAYPTIEDAVNAAKDGDCIFLEPITFTFTETLLIAKAVHIIGVDEVGACAVLKMEGGPLKPPLPILRLSGAKVHLKGLKIVYTHDEGRAAIEAVAQAYAVFVSEGGAAVLDEVSIISSCGGVRGAPRTTAVPGGREINAEASYITATCCKFQCDTTGVSVEGKCFLDRCTVAVGARGIAVHDTATARIEGSGFVGGAIGVDVQRRGYAHVERNAFVGVAIGVNIYNNGISVPQPTIIRGNEFRNPMEAAMRTDGDGAAADISKNLIHGFTSSTAVAIQILDGKPEIRSNVVKDCAGTSIASYGGAPLIESNVLELGRVGIEVRSSRPTIRLNEICLQQQVGVSVESSAVRRGGGGDPSSSSVIGGGGGNESFATNTTYNVHGGRSSFAADSSAAVAGIIHPLSEADPHVEANSFHDNASNLFVRSVTGTFLKNTFGLSQYDNVVLDGPLVVPIVLSGNTIGGSSEGCGVLATNGVEAHITDNEIFDGKVACVMLKGSRFCEVKGNVLSNAQTAFVAMGRSVGRVLENDIEDGMAVDVYVDSQPTVTVIQ